MKTLPVLVANALCLLSAVLLQSQSRPAITGIAFARFYAADAAASEHFYVDTLGLQNVSTGQTAIYPVNTLQWLETLPLPDAALKSRMAAVGFTTRDAAGLQRYLKVKGVAIEHPLHDGEFAVRDPEGNQVWFVQTEANKGVARMQPSSRATSGRVIHVGYVVKDAAKEDLFYQGILGFHPYWHGGRTSNHTDWISLQVPDGTDWLEYMLNIPVDASLKKTGVQDHFSLGTEKMELVLARLKANGCTDANCTKTQVGLDGKVQLNVFDPDLSRVEFMEYIPKQEPCCSPIVGPNPTAKENRYHCDTEAPRRRLVDHGRKISRCADTLRFSETTGLEVRLIAIRAAGEGARKCSDCSYSSSMADRIARESSDVPSRIGFPASSFSLLFARELKCAHPT